MEYSFSLYALSHKTCNGNEIYGDWIAFYSLKSIWRYWSESDSAAHHAVPWEPVGPWFSLPRPGPWLASSVEDAVMASSGICPSSIPSSFNLAMTIKEKCKFSCTAEKRTPYKYIIYYYTSDSLWKIWLVESIQSIHNSLWTWHDKCIKIMHLSCQVQRLPGY